MNMNASIAMNKAPDPTITVGGELEALNFVIDRMETELAELRTQLGPVSFPEGQPSEGPGVHAVVTMPPMAEHVRHLRFRMEGLLDRLIDARMRVSI